MRTRRYFILTATSIIILAVVFAADSVARKRAESAKCASNMISICLTAWVWAGDRDGYLPTNFVSMADELLVTKVLICPADHLRQPATNWESFTPTQSSYAIVTPHARCGDTNVVFLRCPIHGHIGYADGSVFHGTKKLTK